MSVARTIKFRIVTNHENFSDILFQFVTDSLSFNQDNTISTLDFDDIEDFDFLQFSDRQKAKEIFDYRESKDFENHVIVWLSDEESIHFSFKKLEPNFKDFKNQFELLLILGIGKRLPNSDRFTDFSFYLNIFIPKLQKIGCYICEVNCQDFDS